MVNHGMDAMNVIASSSLGYHFVSWDNNSTLATRTDTNIIANATYLATFVIDTHTLTYIADVGGTIIGSSTQTINYGSDGVEVTATPNPGYRFLGWSDNNTSITRNESGIIEDITINALFRKRSRTIYYSTCDNFEYTEWTSCKNKIQMRSIINSYPEGCINGEPVIYQECTLPVIKIKATTTQQVLINVTTVNNINKSSLKPLTKNLQINDIDGEVRQLQKFLNFEGFVISESGAGSPGKETNIFGPFTKDSLIRYQEAHAKEILIPLGLKRGTGYFGKATRDYINSVKI